MSCWTKKQYLCEMFMQFICTQKVYFWTFWRKFTIISFFLSSFHTNAFFSSKAKQKPGKIWRKTCPEKRSKTCFDGLLSLFLAEIFLNLFIYCVRKFVKMFGEYVLMWFGSTHRNMSKRSECRVNGLVFACIYFKQRKWKKQFMHNSSCNERRTKKLKFCVRVFANPNTLILVMLQPTLKHTYIRTERVERYKWNRNKYRKTKIILLD